MKNYSISSLTNKIDELTELSEYSLNEIRNIIEKEMGNYYTSSRLCFTIEDSIYLIYNKIQENREKIT